MPEKMSLDQLRDLVFFQGRRIAFLEKKMEELERERKKILIERITAQPAPEPTPPGAPSVIAPLVAGISPSVPVSPSVAVSPSVPVGAVSEPGVGSVSPSMIPEPAAIPVPPSPVPEAASVSVPPLGPLAPAVPESPILKSEIQESEIASSGPDQFMTQKEGKEASGEARVLWENATGRPFPRLEWKKGEEEGDKEEKISEEKFEKATIQRGDETAGKTEPEMSWEVKLATVWFPRIGGALLLAGAAFGAMLIQPHLGDGARVALGYLVAVVVAGAGFWVQKRNQTLGRVVIAIGVSMAYFISFAAHYLPALHKVFSTGLSLGLMFVFMGSLIGLAEKWKAESAAATGLALGVLAALISARSSEHFALVALGVLAIGAGILLVRHEWTRLTALALVGTYLSTATLWVLVPIEHTSGRILPHLGALIGYHIVFTLAFWRWGRAWVARENAIDEAVLHDAAPEIKPGLLPYSTGFAILNSLGLIALSLLLLWKTRVLWPNVHYLLFGLAAAESARLLIRSLRRGELGSFHVLMGFSLLCAGVVSSCSGLRESVVLAVQALALAIAASRSRLLRFLRPLTAVCAGLAISSYRSLGLLPRPVDLINALIPGILLLGSTLPWEAIWVRRPRRYASGVLAGLEALSGLFRGSVATGLCIAALLSYFGRNEPAIPMATLTLLLLIGVKVLRARTWILGALGAGLMTLDFFSNANVANPAILAFHFLWLALAIYCWQEVSILVNSRVGRTLLFLGLVVFAIASTVYSSFRINEAHPLCGLILGLAATAAGLIGWYGPRIGSIPTLVPEPESEDEPPPPQQFLGMDWSQVRMGYGMSLMLGLTAIVYAALIDAEKSLVSAAALTAAMGGWWVIITSREKAAGKMETYLSIGTLSVAIVSILMFGECKSGSILAAALVAVAGLTAGIRRISYSMALCGLLGLGGMALFCGLRSLGPSGEIESSDSLLGLATAFLTTASTRLLVWGKRRWESHPEAQTHTTIFGGIPIGWLTVWGAGLALINLANSSLLEAKLVTVAWGCIGIALVAAGFIYVDKILRYTAFGVFGVTLVRIFFHDLTGTDIMTKAIAFLGVGLLLVGAAIAYGFLRARLLGKSAENGGSKDSQEK